MFMLNDHLRSSLLQIFHGGQMKLLLHISWSGWDRVFVPPAIDWLVFHCFIANVDFLSMSDRDLASRVIRVPVLVRCDKCS